MNSDHKTIATILYLIVGTEQQLECDRQRISYDPDFNPEYVFSYINQIQTKKKTDKIQHNHISQEQLKLFLTEMGIQYIDSEYFDSAMLKNFHNVEYIDFDQFIDFLTPISDPQAKDSLYGKIHKGVQQLKPSELERYQQDVARLFQFGIKMLFFLDQWKTQLLNSTEKNFAMLAKGQQYIDFKDIFLLIREYYIRLIKEDDFLYLNMFFGTNIRQIYITKEEFYELFEEKYDEGGLGKSIIFQSNIFSPRQVELKNVHTESWMKNKEREPIPNLKFDKKKRSKSPQKQVDSQYIVAPQFPAYNPYNPYNNPFLNPFYNNYQNQNNNKNPVNGMLSPFHSPRNY